MGELTNFGFYKPAEGEDGWASQVNNNADLLEDAFNANKTIPAIDTDRSSVGQVASDNAIHPDFTQDLGRVSPLGQLNYDISAINGSWDVGSQIIDASAQVGAQLEGVAYRDGHIYFGEETGDTSPATIRKYTTAGVDTGESFTFGAGQANHTNSLTWHQGPNDSKPLLWVSDAAGATDKDYIVDFENGTVVDIIDHTGAASLEGIRGFIPATDGTTYLLYASFGDVGYDNAHLVDLEGARADGETNGNITTTLSHDGLTSREQSGVYRNGYYYFCDHRIAAKVKIPFADQIRDGYPITAGENVEWVHARPFDYEFEDFDYNPDDDEWYIGQSTGPAGVRSATEGWGENIPLNWDNWGTATTGVKRPRSLAVDTTTTSDQRIRAIGFEASARATVWVYDHGRTTDEANYVGVNGDGASDDNHTLAIRTLEANGDTNYYRFNSTDSWEDTGVTRPANPQWVAFAFHATGSSMELSISTDLGRTWQDAGTKTVESTKISELIIRCPDGSFNVGTWEIEVLETPTV